MGKSGEIRGNQGKSGEITQRKINNYIMIAESLFAPVNPNPCLQNNNRKIETSYTESLCHFMLY